MLELGVWCGRCTSGKSNVSYMVSSFILPRRGHPGSPRLGCNNGHALNISDGFRAEMNADPAYKGPERRVHGRIATVLVRIRPFVYSYNVSFCIDLCVLRQLWFPGLINRFYPCLVGYNKHGTNWISHHPSEGLFLCTMMIKAVLWPRPHF